MEESDLTYEQLPEHIARVKYDEAREKIIDAYRELSGVVALYDTGTVADPGISDLDIKVIYDPEEDPETPPADAFSGVVDTLVGRGNIIKAPTSAFGKFHYLDPKRNPSHLYGPEVEFSHPPESDRQFREAAYVLDYIPERLYQILRLERSESIPVMRTLQMLKSVGYSCVIMDELLPEFEGQSFADDVAYLRGGWFEREEAANYRRMHELIDEAKDRLVEAARRWFAQTPPAILDAERVEDGAISLFDELVYLSGDEFGYEAGEEFEVRMTIPSRWFDHYRFCATRENVLGRWLQTGYVGPDSTAGCLTSEYERYLDMKLQICNDAFSWSVKHEMGSALKFGYLLYRTGWDEEQKAELQRRIETECSH